MVDPAGRAELGQRYINTMLESGQYFEFTGGESFREWLERGPIIHESFMKSADNHSTRCRVTATYRQVLSDCRLFVACTYRRTVKVTRQNGLIVNVQAQNV